MKTQFSSRRNFIKKSLGATALIAAGGIVPGIRSLSANQSIGKLPDKPIRIGIIGAENSHTRGFGKLFNIDKKFPGVEVLYVWGETEEFAKDAMERGGIPNMVKDPNEMLGKIDALIVDHRHGKYHLEAATPFVKEGIPAFIDKPFCYRVDEGVGFLRMVQELGTPVTSYSSIAHTDSTLDMKEQLESIGKISQIVMYGPGRVDSKYGGVFYYVVHCVQPLMYMLGEDIEKVRITRHGSNASATIAFRNNLMVTLVFNNLHYGWKTFVETEQGVIHLKSRVEEADPPKHYADMVEMFRTGKEPRSHQSIINCVAVLEALEKSADSEKWEMVNFPVL